MSNPRKDWSWKPDANVRSALDRGEQKVRKFRNRGATKAPARKTGEKA